MCNQMVMSEKGSGNFEDLGKTQVKIFSHFKSIPFGDRGDHFKVVGLKNLAMFRHLSCICSPSYLPPQQISIT